MNIKAFLIINDGGSIRVTKNRPYLNNNEISVLLNVDVPNRFFERMIPVVDIRLPEEAVIQPEMDVALSITSQEVADKLKLDAQEVFDGLKDMVERKKQENNTSEN